MKLCSRDLNTLEQLSEKIKGALQTAPGVHELSLEAKKGKLQIVIKVNREAAAQLGLNADDIIEMVQAGIDSKKVSTLMDGVQRFDIQVWLAPEFRNSMEAINNIPIRTPGGALVRLASVVSVEQGEGYTFIRREQLQRYAVIQIKVEGHDVDGFVKEAGEKIKREVKLPAGYWIEWGGAFENQQRAMAKLAVIVPLTIGLIFILLYTAFNSLKYATLIIANVPFAAIGGILSLFISGQYLLVREAVEQDATLRLRPVLMTALVEILGLQPFLLSTGVGAEVMRPLATVVVGGLLTSTALTLLLLALLYEWVEKRSERKIFEA